MTQNFLDEAGKMRGSVSASSSFFPGAHNSLSDTIFRSVDAVLFYVNSEVILQVSRNSLRPVLGGLPLDDTDFRGGLIDISDQSSVVLNIIMHIIYGLSPAKHSPSVLALRIGPVYLNRLVQLHIALTSELRRIMVSPPSPHQFQTTCSFEAQRSLDRAWVLTVSHLAWDLKPDIGVHQIQSAFSALEEHLDCGPCKESLCTRVKEVSVQWMNLKYKLCFSELSRKFKSATSKINAEIDLCNNS